jgi:hypothetical protein
MTTSDRAAAFALVVSVLFPLSALAQQATVSGRVLAVELGRSGFHQRDQNLSPVAFRGGLPSVGIMLEARATRAIWAFAASYGSGHINSAVLPREVYQHVARASLTWLRELSPARSTGDGFSFLAGGGLSTFGAITDLRAIDPATGYSYRDWSWYWSHNLDMAARAQLSLGGRTLALHVSAPILRLVSRPNNGKDYDGDNAWVSASWPRALLHGKPEYFWSRPAFSGEADIRQRLSGRLQLRATYSFTYASAERPAPLGLYMNRITVGLARSF